MSLFLILLAAGDGKRLNTKIPKPYNKINNKTLIEHSIDTFAQIKKIKKTILVYNKKHLKYLNKLHLGKIIKITGGKNRQESTYKALKKIKKMNCKKVLIHDAARPNLSLMLTNKIINSLKKNDIVVPITKNNDATKFYEKNNIINNIDRAKLIYTQTPQGFTFKKIYQKHLENLNQNSIDDSSLFIQDNERIKLINGETSNIKITNKNDLENFRNFKIGKVKYGIGFDIHKFKKNRKLYLGGIKIPFDLGLEGHSDADPVLHSLIDSLLGASGLGDIGKLFSNKREKYKNIRSTILLKRVSKLIKSKNFLINNIDINIITEKPKIKKYSKKMIKVISRLCELNINQINIKGKTTEKLGLIGKEKAIACEVITSITKYV